DHGPRRHGAEADPRAVRRPAGAAPDVGAVHHARPVARGRDRRRGGGDARRRDPRAGPRRANFLRAAGRLHARAARLPAPALSSPAQAAGDRRVPQGRAGRRRGRGAPPRPARRRADHPRGARAREELLFPRRVLRKARAQGREGRLVQARQGQDARGGRRIRVRQDHARPAAHAAAQGLRRRSAVRGPRPAAAAAEGGVLLQAAHPDRVPESVCLAQSALHGGPDPDGADADSRRGQRRSRAARFEPRAARQGGPRRRLVRQVPPRVLRRPAPEDRDRPRACPEAGGPDLRRVGLGARRLGPGPAVEPSAGFAGRIRNELPVHLARPRRGPLHGRRSHGDEGRRDRRDRRPGRDLLEPEASLHASAAFLDARPRAVRLAVLLFLVVGSPPTWAAHAYAQFGDIKYPRGFTHFEWVNPAAPKGGELELVAALRITNFDKYNPFTLKGTSPPGLGTLVFETLLTATLDEPTTAYGLLAEDIEVAADGLSVT